MGNNTTNDENKQRYLSPDEIISFTDTFIQALKEKKVIGHFRQEQVILDIVLEKVRKYFATKAEKLRVNY